MKCPPFAAFLSFFFLSCPRRSLARSLAYGTRLRPQRAFTQNHQPKKAQIQGYYITGGVYLFQAPPLPPKAILDSCDDPSLWQQLCTLVTGSFFVVCFLAFLLGVLFRGWGFYFFAIFYIVCGQNSPPIKLLLLPQVLFRFSSSKIKLGSGLVLL